MAYRALVIGNWKYEDPDRGFKALNGPRHDVSLIKDAICHPDYGLFKASDVTTCENLTWEELRGAFDRFLDSAKPDDKLLLYFSGHGDLLLGGRLALCGVNTASGRLKATSVDTNELREWIHSSNRASATMIVLDCCYSGAMKNGPLTDAVIEQSLGLGTAVLASGGIQPTPDGADTEAPSPFTAAFAAILTDPHMCGDGDGLVTVDAVYERLSNYEPPLRPPPSRNVQMQGTFPLARRATEQPRPELIAFHEWEEHEVENLNLRFDATTVTGGRDDDPPERLELTAFSDYRASAVTQLTQLADAVLRVDQYENDERIQAAVRSTWHCVGLHLFETGLTTSVQERLRTFSEPMGTRRLLKLRFTFDDDAAVESFPWEYLYREHEGTGNGPEPWPLALSSGLLVERVVRTQGPATLSTTIDGSASVGIICAHRGPLGDAVGRIGEGLGRLQELGVVFDLAGQKARWAPFTTAIQHEPKVLVISAPIRRTPGGVEIGFWPTADTSDADWHPAQDLVNLFRNSGLRFGAVVLMTFASRPGHDALRCTGELAGVLARSGVGPVAFVCHSPLYAKYVPERGEDTFPVLLVDVLTRGKRFDDAMYYAKHLAIMRSPSESRRPFGVPGYYVIEPIEPQSAEARATGAPPSSRARSQAPGAQEKPSP